MISMLLALDTATTTASLALFNLESQQLLAELTWQARRRQTQDLLPALQDILRLLDIATSDITALAVATGPGSFTGVRIAVSTAKGIGLGLPQSPLVIGIPTLSVTAAPYLDLIGTVPGGRVCATIQAGRGRYNWAWFGAEDLLHRPAVAEHHAGSVDEFAAALARNTDPIWLAGETAPDLQAAVAAIPNLRCVAPITGMRRAGQLARLAALHLAHGENDALASLQPLYLRNP